MPRSTDELVRALAGRLRAAAPEAEALRRRLHDRPELAHAEHETSRLVEARLGPPDARFGGTGLLYRVGPGARGVVARAELDALPIAERTATRDGGDTPAMHACGHDVHMAALVALVEAARDEPLPVPLWAVFQPSEEAYPSGADLLVRDGAVDGARAAVGCHVHPDVPWGTLAASPGAVNAACDNFRLRVSGSGGHVAYPHRTDDPVLALADIVTTLHARLPRRADPLHPVVLGIGELHAGQGPSIVPLEAHASGTLRTLVEADRAPLRAALQAIAEPVAAAHGCRADFEFTVGEPVLDNDERIVAAAGPLTAAAGLEAGPGFRSAGADDFAFLGSVAPLAMAYVGLAGAPGFTTRPLHHPEFLPPDAAVVQVALGLTVLYAAAVDACAAVTDSPENP
jgi:amidohydrolase